MKTTFVIAALTVVLLLGNQTLSLAQWSSDRKPTVQGMFGDRAMGEPFTPRPSKFGGTLQRGPSGNFLGLSPDARSRMFNPSSAADRYRASRVPSAVVPPAPIPRAAVNPQLLPGSQGPLPLPESFRPIETGPGTSSPPKPDVWMRAPPSPGGSSASGPRVGQPAALGPARGSGAAYVLPLSNQYAVGSGREGPQSIRQVSQGGNFASSLADRLRKTLGRRARSPISVSIIDGTATIRGQVATENDRRLVTYLVMFEPGIRRVSNLLSTEVPGLLSDGT